ncbi:MAG: putative bifunctional diguanylate cyclase/phosphodiesterase [Acidimicrobiales bacterium]
MPDAQADPWGMTLDAGAAARPRLVQLRSYLPTGASLPEEVWWQRHRGILILLWLHVPVVFTIAIAQGVGLLHAMVETSAVVALAALAWGSAPHRALSMVIAAVGLLTCSAVLVHLSHGLIEMHFHFFVMVGVITLYQQWQPFLIALGYVVFQHGAAGVLSPESVYNHPAAVAHPWKWAGVHGLFILGMSAAGIISWRLNESLLTVTRGQQRALESREGELEDALSLLSATLDATADGILVVDLEGQITSTNRRFGEIWSIPRAILDARDDAAALGFAMSQLADPEVFARKVNELYAQPAAESYDTVLFKDGRVIERYSKPQLVGGEIVGRVWSFRDVTQRTQLEDELAHQAFHDSLTGLANQALFRDRVEHALARTARHATPLAVLFLDLDNFKTVNDSLGHTAGDDLLVQVSDRLLSCLRDGDTAARLGGDEFALLIEDAVDEHDAIAVAERVTASLRQPFLLAGKEVFAGASVGIAFADPDLDCDQILRNADLAMYTAKGLGKNRFEVFAPEMHTSAVDRLEVEVELRRALDRGELRLLYQPIVDLSTSHIIGVEALIRWQHPERGLLGPDVFIPVAEDTGLIEPIGRWVIAEACAQAERWNAEHVRSTPMSVSVNVSPRQLRDPQIIDDVAHALASTGVDPACMTFEITEGAMMQDTEVALVHLRGLKALGVQLAVDDFGTGYSSLSYLQRFPIDVLKIDRSFVLGIDRGPEESALARAIVRLAQSLRLVAVAEGVENEFQADMLRRLGCPRAQGYLYARPSSAADIGALLAAEADAPLVATL